MDPPIAVTVILLSILLNVDISWQKYCDVSQTNQGGSMRCYAMKHDELKSDLTNNTQAFVVLIIKFGDVTEMPFDFSWKKQEYLHMLEINQCGLRTIKDDAWATFPIIEKIDFSHNRLHKINKTDFKGLYQLKELYLNNNGIDQIEQTAFDDLVALEKLNLSSNLLIKLDIRLQPKLEWFSISHNPLLEVTPDVFRNADKLELLEIDNINFETILKLLQMLPLTLTSLSMMDTNISTLNATTFRNYHYLRRLSISSNSITQIDDDSFTTLPNLAVIFASRNNLEVIPKALGSLQSLLYLDLSYNRISIFDDDLMSSFSQLKHLDMSNNPLVYENSGPIKKMFGLENLNLKGVGLSQESGLLELLQEKLVDVSLANNNMTSVTSTIFVYCFALIRLDLSYNLISAIEEGSFSRTRSLKEVHLQGNKLSEIPLRLFRRTSSLENLDLSNNNIQEIPVGVFDDLSNLTALNLSYNHINKLHGETFLKTSELRYLYLQGNKINSIPSQLFLSTSNLIHLDISNNHLDDISIGAFDNLHNLIYLNLSINRLKMLDESHLYAMQNLQRLYLHGNRLQRVSGLESLVSISEVSLEDNNWECDSLLDAIKIMKKRYVSLQHTIVRNVTSHLKGIPCSHSAKKLPREEKNHHVENNGTDFGYINVTLLAIILFLICCICIVKVYKKISKNRHIQMYRPKQYSNDYKDVVKVEDENKTNSTMLDEKNSLYNCYEIVE